MAQTTVNSFSALKTAALDINIDYIVVTEDITIGSGGILLPKNKPSLTIDCMDEFGNIHKITDIISNSHSNCIRVDSTVGSYHLTLKNCEFIGRNYYGAISTLYSDTQATTITTLENVTYSGPQAVYNRYGIVEIINGNYRIGQYNSTTAATNEFIEGNTIFLSGNISVHHDGNSNSCIFLTEANSSLTIRENANVNFEVVQRELLYVGNNITSVTLESYAKVYAKTYWSLFYSAVMNCSSFIIGEGAEFVLDQQSPRSGVATVCCSGNLSMLPDSRLILIKKEFSSTDPLLLFTTTASATFSNPRAVVLYNPSGKTIAVSGGTTSINIEAEMINYWLTATAFPDAGGIDDIPLRKWTKADGSNAEITATLRSSVTQSVNSNLVQDEDTDVLPTTSTFNLITARVLSFGSMPLEVMQPHENDVYIIGTTLSGADMRAVVNRTSTYSSISFFGEYIVPISTPLSKNDDIIIYANVDFKTKSASQFADGIIEMTLPAALNFLRIASPTPRSLYNRKYSWQIIITDSRVNGSDWELYAHATTPLSSDTATLPDSLVYKEVDVITAIDGIDPILIYEGSGNTNPDQTVTTISWGVFDGLLLRPPTNVHLTPGKYRTAITFTLVEK